MKYKFSEGVPTSAAYYKDIVAIEKAINDSGVSSVAIKPENGKLVVLQIKKKKM